MYLEGVRYACALELDDKKAMSVAGHWKDDELGVSFQRGLSAWMGMVTATKEASSSAVVRRDVSCFALGLVFPVMCLRT